jgi:DNA-binding SARP family transcriptional activator
MTSLSIRLLGPFQVTLEDQPVAGFETAKARALLAYLAAEPDRPHRREALAEMLWSDRPEGAARANLRHALLTLRKAIGDHAAAHTERQGPPFLAVTRDAIQLNVDGEVWVDVAAFARSAAQGMLGVRPNLGQLEAAVSLYRGPFLADLSLRDSAAFEEWALLRREEFSRQALDVLHRLAECHERFGEVGRALAYARRQLELEPWDEKAQRQAMRLLALDGQRDAALAQYQACVRVLAQELDVEPEEATTELYACIRDGGELPAPDVLVPHNLPAQLAPFVGRERELAEIVQRLADPACRLLSLVGPGGSGKTRLAIEAARAQLDAYKHGVYFCALAPLRSVEAIVPTVAQAIGLSFSPGPPPRRQLIGYLRHKRVLLVVDNCEHLLTPLAAPSPPEGGTTGG